MYMETQCLQPNKMQHYLGKENAQLTVEQEIESGLIKSLIYVR